MFTAPKIVIHGLLCFCCDMNMAVGGVYYVSVYINMLLAFCSSKRVHDLLYFSCKSMLMYRNKVSILI